MSTQTAAADRTRTSGAASDGAATSGAANEQASAGTWRRICPLEELEPMWGEAALVDGVQIALIRLTDERLFAVSHWDPYAKANVMARGIVGSRGGRPTLASPIHKQVYDLETGECLSEDGLALAVYEVRVIGGNVELRL